MTKYFFLIITLILTHTNSFSQTGINTRTPEQSSVLDVSATNKGVLMPKYTLTTLDNATFPINGPVEGTLIYNIGGTHQKGYYFWNGSIWSRMVVNNEMDQIFNLQIPILEANKQLIPANTYTTNYINFTSFSQLSIINTLQGGGVSGQNITLPAGKYKVDIALTVSSPGTNAANFMAVPFNPQEVVNLYGVDVELHNGATPIAPMKYGVNISGENTESIQGYRYFFVFELTSASTTIRLNVKQGSGRTSSRPTDLAHTGLMLSFRKFLE